MIVFLKITASYLGLTIYTFKKDSYLISPPSPNKHLPIYLFNPRTSKMQVMNAFLFDVNQWNLWVQSAGLVHVDKQKPELSDGPVWFDPGELSFIKLETKGRRALKDNERLFNFWLYSENLASFPSSAVRGYLVQVNHKKHLSFFDEKRPDNQHILGWFYFWYFANCFVLLLQSKISYFTVQMN